MRLIFFHVFVLLLWWSAHFTTPFISWLAYFLVALLVCVLCIFWVVILYQLHTWQRFPMGRPWRPHSWALRHEQLQCFLFPWLQCRVLEFHVQHFQYGREIMFGLLIDFYKGVEYLSIHFLEGMFLFILWEFHPIDFEFLCPFNFPHSTGSDKHSPHNCLVMSYRAPLTVDSFVHLDNWEAKLFYCNEVK